MIFSGNNIVSLRKENTLTQNQLPKWLPLGQMTTPAIGVFSCANLNNLARRLS